MRNDEPIANAMITTTTRRSGLYDPHETDRMRELEGRPLASFGRRGAAFVIDFFLCFGLFLIGLSALALRIDRDYVRAPREDEGQRAEGKGEGRS